MARFQLHGLVADHVTLHTDAPTHELLRLDGMSALVSTLPATTEFDPSRPEDVAAWAMIHHAILVAYCAENAVLPMALGAAFSSKRAIVSALDTQQADHRRALEELGNLREFTIQLSSIPASSKGCDKAKFTPPTGRAFLRARQSARDNRQNVTASQKAYAAQILEKLYTCAEQITHRSKSERWLDCAGLFPKSQIPTLRQIARTCHTDARARGLDLVIAGPWPPYSYDLEARDARPAAP